MRSRPATPQHPNLTTTPTPTSLREQAPEHLFGSSMEIPGDHYSTRRSRIVRPLRYTPTFFSYLIVIREFIPDFHFLAQLHIAISSHETLFGPCRPRTVGLTHKIPGDLSFDFLCTQHSDFVILIAPFRPSASIRCIIS